MSDGAFLHLRQTATPNGNAQTGGVLFYFKTDGKAYTKIAGVETLLSDVTQGGTQTLTNKTLTGPRVDVIKDTDGDPALNILPNAGTAVNYAEVRNGATGAGVTVAAVGSDANINLGLNAKGIGQVFANGVAVADVSTAETLTNKTLSTGTKVGAATTDISGAWTAWTPTFTNLTIGNGVVVARYMQIGKTVHIRLNVTGGTTTSATGNVSCTLPVSAHASGVQELGGGAYAATASGVARAYVNGPVSQTVLNWQYAAPALTFVTVLGNGHVYQLNGTYEAA